MKKILYLIALSIMPMALLTAEHGPRNIEGIWVSSHGHDQLKIQAKNYGIKVKGVAYNNRFESIGHHTFTNYTGVKIRFVGSNELVVTKKKNGAFRQTVITRRYFRASTRGSRNGDRGRNQWTDDHRWNERHDDEYSDSNRGRNSETTRNRNNHSNRNSLVGTWKTQGLDINKRVIIKSSETGIQAKFKNKDKWTFYAQDNRKSNVFTDRLGNQYILRENGKLVWKGNGQKTFTLVRM